MKYVLLVLFTFEAYATTLGQHLSTPESSSNQIFTLTAGNVTYEKDSNFFDHKKDFRLGKFEARNSEKLSSITMRLEEMLTKIKSVDEALKKQHLSFNELSVTKPHESFLLIDKYRVTKKSDLYPELKKVYDELLENNWKQVSGVKISEDLKQMITVNDGKEVATDAYNLRFNCKNAEPPTVCAYKDLGTLYIQ